MFLAIAAVLTASCLLTEGHVVDKKATDRAKREVSTCKDGYENVPGSAISTMCLEDSDLYVPGSAGVDDATKANILSQHNQYREEVQANGGSPKMVKMYWDDELARVAEKWAKQCHGGHEGLGEWKHISSYIPLFGRAPGQNKAAGTVNPTFEKAITNQWYDEKADFQYGVVSSKTVGHYTQMIAETVNLIGCGYAKCEDDYENYYVCNYMPGQTSLEFPYQKGDSCKDCTQHCSNGKLCDCGNKPCYHGGKLDFDTCKCKCPSSHKGDDCREEACPGISDCTGNHGVLDPETCECKCLYKIWTGDRCQTKKCFTPDAFFCAKATAKECATYSNYPWDCPTNCKFDCT